MLLLRRVISFTFYAVCFGGFLFQVERISRAYLQYKTTSIVKHDMQSELQVPTITMCIRYMDIMDWDALYRDKQINRRFRRSNRWRDLVTAQSILTIRQILDYTPPVHALLKATSYRKRDSYLEYYDGIGNRSVFDIHKYYMQEAICYQFKPIDQTPKLFQRIANSLHSSGSMFRMILSDILNRTDVFMVALHFRHSRTASFYFGQTMNRLSNYERLTPIASLFFYTYSITRITLMPVPYDTACHPAATEKSVCMHNCLLKRMISRLGKAPFQTYIQQPLDVRHVSHEDMLNETTKLIVQQVDDECTRKCLTMGCHYHFIATRLDHVSLETPSRFAIVIRVPQTPGIALSTIVTLDMIAYLTYIGSSISSWFGLSALALDPFRFLSRRLLASVRGKRVRFSKSTKGGNRSRDMR